MVIFTVKLKKRILQTFAAAEKGKSEKLLLFIRRFLSKLFDELFYIFRIFIVGLRF